MIASKSFGSLRINCLIVAFLIFFSFCFFLSFFLSFSNSSSCNFVSISRSACNFLSSQKNQVKKSMTAIIKMMPKIGYSIALKIITYNKKIGTAYCILYFRILIHTSIIGFRKIFFILRI